MKRVAVVICNYNKKEDVLACIQAVLDSDYANFDIYVVDNGSTDGSVAAIEKQYGEKLHLLAHKENLGGTGGFNSGLDLVKEKDYAYVMCLDNDAMVTPTAISAMVAFLESHEAVGMVGAKVYHRQYPDYVQQMGICFSFAQFGAETLYADVLDGPDIPETVYCDAVAACAVMLPMQVLRQVGGMPRDTFLYWDDMEWGYKVKQAGYQVAVTGSAKVYHTMSANTPKKDTFSIYYLWRNRVHFYLKYTKEAEWDAMCQAMLQTVFREMYMAMYQEAHNVSKTIQIAFFDGIMNVMGKANPEKILPYDGNKMKDKWKQVLQKSKTIAVEDSIQMGLAGLLQEQMPQVQIVEKAEGVPVWKSCADIMQVSSYKDGEIYVDVDGNLLCNAEDWQGVSNYTYSLVVFVYMHQELLHYRKKIS